MGREVAEEFPEVADLRLQLCQRILVLENFQTRQSGSAPERVAAVAVPVKKRPHLRVIAEECLENPFCGQRGGQRHCAPGQALGEGQKVREHAFVLAGEHLSGATEAGHHLVEDQEHAVPVAPRAQFAQHSLGPLPHARCTLDQRLDDHPSQRTDGLAIEFLHRRHSTQTHDRKLQCGKTVMERTDAAKTRGPCGVSMVGVLKRGKPASLGMTSKLVELDCHLQSNLDRSGSVIGEKNARKSLLWKKPDQLLRQADRRLVGKAEKRAVRELGGLVADGCDHARMGVTVDIRPDGAVAVEILSPLNVDQPAAAPLDQDHRLMPRSAPVPHLREGMPQVALVSINKLRACHVRRIHRRRPQAIQARARAGLKQHFSHRPIAPA